eukprot:292208_1
MAESQQPIKSGFLQKKSRYIGSWRERWTTLISDKKQKNVYRLCTFTHQDKYQKLTPTEYIRIDINTEIKVSSWTGNEFFVENISLNERFLFRASSPDIRDEWVQSLILRTDVGSLSDILFDDTDLSRNSSVQRKNRNKSKTDEYKTIIDNRDMSPEIQSHIDEMRKRHMHKNGKITIGNMNTNNGNNVDNETKIMHWIEMEILLKTSNDSYFQLIIANEFDNLEIIQKITNQNLIEIGIDIAEHRTYIMEVISKIHILLFNCSQS